MLGMSQSDAQNWEDYYQKTPTQNLPWNAGGPDPDLVRLVKAGQIPQGQALDIGTGPGHDAVFLIEQGFNVIAIDISPTAVRLAREHASNNGLFGFFQVGDVRHIPVEDRFIDFANDRGCFHTLSPDDRPKAVEEIARVLRAKGVFFLRVFSDKQPPGPGPYRFTQVELENLFKSLFHIRSMWEGVYESPTKAKTWAMLMEKR